MSVQALAFILLLGTMGGLLYAFLRSGVSIKPDRNRRNEDWPNITSGGPN
jgi:hypothetical protein